VEPVPALVLACAVVSVASLVAIVHGVLRRGHFERQLIRALRSVPRDRATGLFDRRVCMQRVAAELKRARRSNWNAWVGIVTVVDGDPTRFGRVLHDSLRQPEVGFRLSPQVMCVVRPQVDDATRADLIGRIIGAAPRELLALGEATWSSPADGTAADLLRAASSATRDVGAR